MSLFFASSAIILPYNWPIRSFGFRAKTQPAVQFLSTASRKPVRGFGSAVVGPDTTLPGVENSPAVVPCGCYSLPSRSIVQRQAMKMPSPAFSRTPAPTPDDPAGRGRPVVRLPKRVALLGFHLESNAFAPVSDAAAFHSLC